MFSPNEPPKLIVLNDIRQIKGEAELAQIDWLMHYDTLLNGTESAVSFVSSGVIDAVQLHMFAIASHWPRSPHNQYKFNQSAESADGIGAYVS